MKTFTLLFAMVSFCALSAQNIVDQNKSISVNGYAEIEVIPNEIFLSFTVKERQEGKTMITVEETEKLLFTGLKKLDLDAKNLSVGDIDANYEKINWRKKGVQTSTQYNLKLKNAKEIYEVLNLLEILKVKGAHISKVDHSDKEQFEKDIKVKALKNAQEEATLLTDAIGEKTDGVLKITRINVFNPFNANSNHRKDNRRYAVVAEYNNEDIGEVAEPVIQFKKMKFTSNVMVTYKLQ